MGKEERARWVTAIALDRRPDAAVRPQDLHAVLAAYPRLSGIPSNHGLAPTVNSPLSSLGGNASAVALSVISLRASI
jgi:hypothetical protein